MNPPRRPATRPSPRTLALPAVGTALAAGLFAAHLGAQNAPARDRDAGPAHADSNNNTTTTNTPAPRGEPVALSAGTDFTCARDASGSVRCWGANGVGQLGDGTTLDRAEPTAVVDLPDAVDVSAGRYHACAVRADRSVWCWGDAARACFDPGRGGVRTRPSRVRNAPPAVRVFAGDAHTCALTDSGEVYCWGEGAPGHEPVSPAAVAGVRGATDVVSAGDVACARLGDGAVKCWSIGSAMQAQPLDGAEHTARIFAAAGVCTAGDDGHTACAQPRADAARGVFVLDRPADHSAPTRWTSASGSARAGCSVDESGTVRCWGAWDDPEGVAPAMPARPRGGATVLTGAGPAVQVTVGPRHACALGRDGTVRCWGANTVGQLGDGEAAFRATAAEVPGVLRVESLGLGSDVSCAVLRGGTASCWGRNNDGALGDGTRINRRAPAAVAALAGAVEIAPVGDHACARMRNGTVRCWGTGRAGEGAGVGVSLRPVVVRGLRGAQSLDGAYSSVCALGSGGGVQCVGDTGGFATEAIAGVSGLTRFAVGRCVYDPYVCGVAGDGSVVCSSTAGGAHGELGAGAGTGMGTGTGAGGRAVAGVSGAADVAAGMCFACSVGRDGGVSCWGEEPDGRGVSPEAPAGEAHGARAVAGLTDVEQVAAGDHHACARRRDGTVWCWGNNQYGQLGDGTREGRARPVQVGGVSDAVEVAAGARHSCARLRDGSVWCWGENHWGQLGDGAPAGRAEAAPVRW